jgi:hypothetical protein
LLERIATDTVGSEGRDIGTVLQGQDMNTLGGEINRSKTIILLKIEEVVEVIYLLAMKMTTITRRGAEVQFIIIAMIIM